MRSFLTVSLAITIAFAASGCGVLTNPYQEQFRDGGMTPALAEQQLLAVEGITDADFATVEWYSPGEGGLFSASGMNIVLSVTVDPQYTVANDAVFLEFLAATAWSVNDHYPKGQVVLAVTGGADPSHDWAPGAREVFGSNVYVSDYLNYMDDDVVSETATRITINVDEYARVFGRWPSEPVATPRALFINEPPVVPAVSQLTMTEFLNEAAEECVRIDFVRGETYTGPVAITLHNAEGVIVREKDTESSELTSCFFAGERPVGGYVTVAAERAPGYSAVSETVLPE